MTAKVENYCMTKRCKLIKVDANEKVCLNCIWYEQYHRRGRGSVYTWEPVSIGNCLLKDKTRGALSKPCARFEIEERRTNERTCA